MEKTMERNGCVNCNWLTLTASPIANARYHTNIPSHADSSVTYTNPPHAAVDTAWVGHV